MCIDLPITSSSGHTFKFWWHYLLAQLELTINMLENILSVCVLEKSNDRYRSNSLGLVSGY